MPQKYVILYASYLGPVEGLSDEDAGMLFKAVLQYANGDEPQLPDGAAKVAFEFIRAQMDGSMKKYTEKTGGRQQAAPASGKPEKKAEKKPAKKTEEKKRFAEFVTMTDREYSALVTRFGEPAARRMIEILDNYKGSSKKNQNRYTSDYRAILSWVVNRYQEEEARRPKNGPAQPQDTGNADSADDWQKFFQEGYR